VVVISFDLICVLWLWPGFALVKFGSTEEAEKAIETMNSKDIGGRRIQVREE